MRERHRYINNASKTASVNSKHEVIGSNSVQKKYKLILNPADAVILHPSFLCPALKKAGDELHLFLLGDWRFNTTFENAEGKEDNKAGPALCGAINRFLKIVKWDSIDKGNHAPKPLFASPGEVKDNITVYKLWEVRKLKDGILTDYQGKKFAQVHPDVLQLYKDNLLSWGFEVVIKNLPMDGDPGLYDISWMNYARAEEEDESGYFFELQDEYINDFNKKFRSQYFPLQCDVSDINTPVFLEKETEIQSYHPLYISDKACLSIGHLSDVHVSSRQHLFTQSKAKLIEGDDNSDEIGGMVNTSYSTLRNLMGQMAEDPDIDLLIFTGDLIDYNRNYNPDYGKEKSEQNKSATENNSSDSAKKQAEQEKKSSEIWKELNLDNLTDRKRYPLGIDNLVMYELFRWYYKTYKKPIMLISGNHEAYTLPYGISPRIKFFRSGYASLIPASLLLGSLTADELIQKSIKQAEEDREAVEEAEKASKGANIYFDRANEGVPADHNLTITEAILMYGPDYARVVAGGSSGWGGEQNFRVENLDWFFHVFTPLTSFYSTYGDQCFIGLGWGSQEKFIGHVPESGKVLPAGILPRAVESVSDLQLEILEQALKMKKTQKMLCTHFTFANYHTLQAMSKEGKVHFYSSYTQHDYGTFQMNRDMVYPLLVKKDEIQYTLSGHSHRSALYQFNGKIKPTNPRGRSFSWRVVGQVAKEGKFKPKDGVRMLVAASGGPIPVQNHNHELFNMGLDRPSGNYIKFSGSSESEVGIKVATNNNSKPRLAVALDFADIFLMDKKKGRVFEVFESKKNREPIQVEISEEVKLDAADVFEKMKLVIYAKDRKEEGNYSRIELDGVLQNFDIDCKKFEVKIQTRKFHKILNNSVDGFNTGFIKITLNSGGTGTEVYDTRKHWVFPIELIGKQKKALKEYEEVMKEARSLGAYSITNKMIEDGKKNIIKNVNGFLLRRHSIYGEIPDFRFYRDILPDEYLYDVRK